MKALGNVTHAAQEIVCVIWFRGITQASETSGVETAILFHNQVPALDLQGQRSGGSGSAVRTTVDGDAGYTRAVLWGRYS